MKSKFARLERDGKVAFTDGENKLIVPTREALRERLIKLLEDAGGDKNHKTVEVFWKDRCRDTGAASDMKRAWGLEIFERLYAIWQELTGEEKKSESMEDIYGG